MGTFFTTGYVICYGTLIVLYLALAIVSRKMDLDAEKEIRECESASKQYDHQ